jgi:hypothetical protein
LLRYRSLFDELLHDGPGVPGDGTRQAGAENGAAVEQGTDQPGRARHLAAPGYDDSATGGPR